MASDHEVKIKELPILVIKEEKDTSKDAEKNRKFEYQLKVEAHADKFFEMRHKITFFLITAVVGSTAFTLNFSISHLDEISTFLERKLCLGVAAVVALLTVIFALMSMYYDVYINRLNLAAYFDRKLYDELSENDKTEWIRTGVRADNYQKLAFTFLIIGIGYQGALFILFII